MTSDAVRRRVFRRILAHEAGTGASAAAIAAAARRVCERFAERLAPLIGDGVTCTPPLQAGSSDLTAEYSGGTDGLVSCIRRRKH